jgi:hypothetical protein
MRGFHILLVVCALCLVATGCGGGRLSKTEYVKQFKAVVIKAGQEGNDAQSGGNTAQVDGLQKALDTAVDGLDDLNPPKEVESAHNNLVDVIRYIRDERLPPIRDALKDGDSTKAAQEATKPLPADIQQKETSAQAQFKKLGYDLGQDELTGGLGGG